MQVIPVQYVKKNGVWSLDEHYELLKPTGAPTPAAGYYGGWELDGKELTADSQISVTSPADTLTVTWINAIFYLFQKWSSQAIKNNGMYRLAPSAGSLCHGPPSFLS